MSDEINPKSTDREIGQTAPEPGKSKVTFSSLTKNKGPITLTTSSPTSTPYTDQIKERLASEQPQNMTPAIDKKEKRARHTSEELDRYIYLRLPKTYGHALRIHAFEKNEKVTDTITRIVLDYMQKNNIHTK